MKRTTTLVFVSPVRPPRWPESLRLRIQRACPRVSMGVRPVLRRDGGGRRDRQRKSAPGVGRFGRRLRAHLFVLICLLGLPQWALADDACISRPGQGPEMLLIEPGQFLMGSPRNEPVRDSDEGPQRRVTIQRPFALSRCEVTVGEFRLFVEDTGYSTDAEAGDGCQVWDGSDWVAEKSRSWRDPGFEQTDQHPVACVSWNDASAYARWLSLRTGVGYRLPTEAEWEYAARAGTTTPFWTGNCIDTDQANYDGTVDYNDCGARTGNYRRKTVPAGSLSDNPWGLHEVHGSVWEWVEDVYHADYSGAPADGSAQTEGGGPQARRVLRGGSWGSRPRSSVPPTATGTRRMLRTTTSVFVSPGLFEPLFFVL